MNCNLFLTFQDVVKLEVIPSPPPPNIVEANELDESHEEELDAEPPKEDGFHPPGENLYMFE